MVKKNKREQASKERLLWRREDITEVQNLLECYIPALMMMISRKMTYYKDRGGKREDDTNIMMIMIWQ